MLSGETANGAHPSLVVSTMSRIASSAELALDYKATFRCDVSRLAWQHREKKRSMGASLVGPILGCMVLDVDVPQIYLNATPIHLNQASIHLPFTKPIPRNIRLENAGREPMSVTEAVIESAVQAAIDFSLDKDGDGLVEDSERCLMVSGWGSYSFDL